MADNAFSAWREDEYETVSAASVVAARGHPPTLLKVESHRVGARVLVTVAGEIDLDTEQTLHDALRKALDESVSGVDLDLGGVEFCDCSGLNVLLHTRRRALRDAKTVVVQTADTAVERLLAVTGTSALFAPADDVARATALPGRGTRPCATHGSPEEDALPGDAERDLRIEVVQLKRAMQTRPVIDLARGVLMASFALSPEDAWRVLVVVSQRSNTKLHHLAQDLVGAVQGDSLPEPLRQQLAAAITDLAILPPAPVGGADDGEASGHEERVPEPGL